MHSKGAVLEGGRVRPYSAWMWSTVDQLKSTPKSSSERSWTSSNRWPKWTRRGPGEVDLEFKMGVVIEMYGHLDIEPDGSTGAVVATPALYLSPGTLLRLTRLMWTGHRYVCHRARVIGDRERSDLRLAGDATTCEVDGCGEAGYEREAFRCADERRVPL